AVAAHPKDPQTAWFVPGMKDELRMPRGGALAVTRTRDGGKSWETLRDGLPQRDAYDLVYRHGLDVDSTGTQVVMGSITGALWSGPTSSARSLVMKPASTVSTQTFSSVPANLPRSALLSSLARCARPRVQAKIDAIELVEVSLPFWCSR